MKSALTAAMIVGLMPALAPAGEQARAIKHVVVYYEAERFAGWPANNGIWSWGDEIVVGFTLGYHKEKEGHTIDGGKPSVPRLARSLDGGETWAIEVPTYLDADGKEREPVDPPGGIDFMQPNFAFMFRMTGSNHGYSRFYYSTDRCKTWQGPFKLPGFGRKGIFARTDYIIESKHELLAFLTAAKEDGNEGWPFMARTTDGGKTWKHVSWIGEQPEAGGYSIMPSTLRISSTELLTWIRRRAKRPGLRSWWIEMFRSTDNGKSWKLIDGSKIDNAGNPPHMIRLEDGRFALTYGHRTAPFGIRAKLSSDNGRTWSDEIILRDDGARWDVGYPRTVQRKDGKIVTAYYFNDAKQKERYIGATIWDPGTK